MENVNEHGYLKKKGIAGFAHLYLLRCDIESKSNQIDIQIYTKLIELDSRLGTTASEQLFGCLQSTIQSDVIKVHLFLNSHLKIYLDHQL